MNWRAWILPTLLLVLAGLIFWSPDFLWQLRRLEHRSGSPENEVHLLRAENTYLKAQLAEVGDQPLRSLTSFESVVAGVYSHYPRNFKHELIINRGEAARVNQGAAVFAAVSNGETSNPAARLFLIGTVATSSATRSFVRTIFNPDFRGATRIGQKKISGLLVGGLSPTITTIPREARLVSGDVIVSASPDLPLGVLLGRIKDVRPSSDELFKEASLEVPYDINNLTTVVVEVR